MSHSIYDSLGFVSPVLIEVKLLLRELGELGWDDRISEDQIVRCKKWLASLQHLEKLRINRCFKVPGLTGKLMCELHYFADASAVAYRAVSYLRMIDDKREEHCSFVMGKYHLTPSRPITVPRLDLLAAAPALRLVGIVKQELGLRIAKHFFGPIRQRCSKASTTAVCVSRCLLPIAWQKSSATVKSKVGDMYHRH